MLSDHPPTRLKFGGLEVARGIAAMAVAAYHGGRLLAEPRYTGVPPANGLFVDFNAGVDFFFVLSGFLITWVHWPDIGDAGRIRHYALRRITRIYPAYWVALLPMLVARLLHLGSKAGSGPDASNIICSIFLLPSATLPILGVAWTLVFEMFFYVLFGFAMLAGRRWSAVLAGIWAVAIIAANWTRSPDSFPAAFILNPYNLEFLLGVSSAVLLRNLRVPFARYMAIAGIVLFISLVIGRIDLLIGATDLPLRLLYGLAAASFVLGMVELERAGGLSLPPWLALLGAASYAIYLVHSMVEPIVVLAAWRWLARVPPVVVTVLLMAIGTLAGIAFHLMIEKPLMQTVRRAMPVSKKSAIA